LALIVTHPSSGVPKSHYLFVPDQDVRWVSLVDIRCDYFRRRRSRVVHWATVRRTKVRFGMPTIGGASESQGDVRTLPYCGSGRSACSTARGREELDAAEDPRLLRLLN